jgi:glycogen(starch) synthase
MRLLMLGWELPPHNSGGLGVACFYMARALSRAGAKIDFIVPYTASHSQTDFMTVHNATPLKPLFKNGMGAYDSRYVIEVSKTQLAMQGLHTIRDVQHRYIEYVEDLVTSKEIDVIHAHDWLTMEAGVRAKEITGAPLVVHVHATEYDRSGHYAGGNPIVHEIEQQALMIADKIIAVSNNTKHLIVQKYGIPASKIDVIYNALDIESLTGYIHNEQTYGYISSLKKEGYTIVGAITRFTVQKGLTQLLEAMAKACSKYDKLVLLLAGDGEQRDELLRLSADLGIADKVLFTGFVRGQEWRDAFSAVDIFVMSSVSEPFGLTALEAAHHDSALILTNQSGVGEVLSNVLRYDFWDTDKLADQLVGVATSHSLRQELAENVKHEYANISWRQVASTCMALYGRLGEFSSQGRAIA